MNVNRKIKKAMALAMTGTVIASSIMYDVSAADRRELKKKKRSMLKQMRQVQQRKLLSATG